MFEVRLDDLQKSLLNNLSMTPYISLSCSMACDPAIKKLKNLLSTETTALYAKSIKSKRKLNVTSNIAYSYCLARFSPVKSLGVNTQY